MGPFVFSIGDLINFFMIAAGIGVLGLSIVQIRKAPIDGQTRKFFVIFLSLVIVYITMYLVRMLLLGNPGEIPGMIIRTAAFIEFFVSGIMTSMMTFMIMAGALTGEKMLAQRWVITAVLFLHTALLIIAQFTGMYYYFDENNIYHRSGLYFLSNVAPVILLTIGMLMLIRYRRNFTKRVAAAFWIYLLAPLGAIILQAFYSEVKFIIIATIGAAVNMFAVITDDLTQKFEKQRLESSRIETELGMATDIQASQLPRLFPAFPKRDEFDLFASMTPAKEVGGDFYDFFLIDDDHIGLVMADVSGKGVPGALFMMVSRVLIKSHLQNGESPGEALASVNDQMCENNDTGLFVTVWAAVLQISTGKGVAVNAGHENPALMRAGGKFEMIVYKHSPAVATIEGIRFREHEFELHPGDSLFVYTDGVAEATNSRNELFGAERTLDALNRDPGASPKDILDNVMDGINSFVAEAEQFDDITMLCFRYNGTASA